MCPQDDSVVTQGLQLLFRNKKILRRIFFLKQGISPKYERQYLAIFDGLLWGIGKVLQFHDTNRDKHRNERLQELLQRSSDTSQQSDQLQRDVMEIPSLAPPNHSASVDVLARLLNHPDKYVRVNACKSLARIGGEKANQILQKFRNNKTVGLVAKEALCFIDACAIAEELLQIPDIERKGEEVLPFNPNWANCEAYLKEEEILLSKYRGQFAVYFNGERIALGPDENQVYVEARKKVPSGLLMIQHITPPEERPIIRFRSPRIKGR